jgi:3-oxoacyl-[acyl-carrier-protein] synthase II
MSSRAEAKRDDDAIVVTGAGVVTPVATGRAPFRSALAGLPAEATLASAAPRTRIDPFDASGLPEAKSLRRATSHVLFGVAAAREALAEAGGGVAPEEVGLLFASMLGSANVSYRLWQELIRSGPLGASPVHFSEGVPNAVAGHVAHALRVLGPGHMVGGGSDCGLRAIALARDLLEARRVRRVLVGAAEESTELAQRAYARYGLARAPDRPRGAWLSEGAAALCLERAGEARSRRLATLLAVESVQLPSLRGAAAAGEVARLFERTLEAAGVAARDVWLASAANGTPADRLEAAALVLLEARGLAPRRGRSMKVRTACGDAFSVTPLLQVVEALDAVAAGGIAAILSLSSFAAASLALFGPVRADSTARIRP